MAIEPSYEHDLAADSIRSLTFQGGAMKPEEVTTFQAEDDLDIKLIFRSLDERGKDPSMVHRTPSQEGQISFCEKRVCKPETLPSGVQDTFWIIALSYT